MTARACDHCDRGWNLATCAECACGPLPHGVRVRSRDLWQVICGVIVGAIAFVVAWCVATAVGL